MVSSSTPDGDTLQHKDAEASDEPTKDPSSQTNAIQSVISGTRSQGGSDNTATKPQAEPPPHARLTQPGQYTAYSAVYPGSQVSEYAVSNPNIRFASPYVTLGGERSLQEYAVLNSSTQDNSARRAERWYDVGSSGSMIYSVSDQGYAPATTIDSPVPASNVVAHPVMANTPTMVAPSLPHPQALGQPVPVAPAGLLGPVQSSQITQFYDSTGYDHGGSYNRPLNAPGVPTQYPSVVSATTTDHNPADRPVQLSPHPYMNVPTPQPSASVNSHYSAAGHPQTALSVWHHPSYAYGYRYLPYVPGAATYEQSSARPEVRSELSPESAGGRMDMRYHPAHQHQKHHDATASTQGISNPSDSSYMQATGAQAPELSALGMGQLTTDAQGIPWLTFEYSRDRVQCSYHIRCDIDNVDENLFSETFRKENCIYPRAMVSREEYRGHRQHYETVCNQIGWRLAFRNPVIQNRRGLIQRAVDTYRNSSQDVSTRSRRARRLVKQQEKERKRQMQLQHRNP